ncbi:MAG: hypothetical protein MJ157_04680, partial [Clostridia bacterium]|nr:hypothetical protein [Clostridia bacterium]
QRLVLSLTSFLRQKMVDWWEDPTLDNKSQWLEALHLLSGLEPEMRWNSQPRIILELALVQACHLLSRNGSEKAGDLELKIGDLEREIQALLAGANQPVKLEAAENQIVLPVEADELSEPKMAESGLEMDVWEEIGDFSQLSSVKPAIQASISPPKDHREIKADPNPAEEANQKTKKKAKAVAETNPEVQPISAAIQSEIQQRLKKITADWPEVLNYIQSYPEYNHLGAYLNNGQGAWPWQLWDQNLLVAIWTGDSGSKIMFELLEEEANRKALAQAVEKVCGWKPEIRFQLTEQKPPLKKAVRPSVKSEVENLFEAEEVRNNPLADNPFEDEPF